MIETLFVRASFLAQLLEPPLGSYLESLAERLQAQNYSLEVIRTSFHAVSDRFVNPRGSLAPRTASRNASRVLTRVTFRPPGIVS